MKICVHNVLPEWVEVLRAEPPEREANLWRQDERNFIFHSGQRIYFKLNDGSWRIVGRGIFSDFQTYSVQDAWSHFEEQNGCYDLDHFLEMINNRATKPFEESSTIGCIHLRSIEWLNRAEPFVLPDNLWGRGPGIELCKYFELNELSYIETEFDNRCHSTG